MPTILDELVVKLGIDSSGFKRDASTTQATLAQVGAAARREGSQLEQVLVKTQTETQKRMRQVEEVGKSAAQGFTRLRNEVTGLLATIAGAYGLEQFVRNLTATDSATGYLARTIGISTESLSTWQEAAKRTGGSAEATGASMRRMSQEIQHFGLTHQSSLIPVLRMLEAMPGRSVALTDAAGNARSVEDLYAGLHDRLSKMTLPRAVAVGGELGIDEGTVRLLHMADDEYKKLFDHVRQLGPVTEEEAAAATRLQNSFSDIQQAVTRLGDAVMVKFTPALTAAIDNMTQWVVTNRDWLQADIEQKLRALVEVLKTVGSGIQEVVGFLGGWKVATEIIFGMWVIGKVSPIISVIRLLAGAMGALATATGAVDVAAGGGGIRWLLGVLGGVGGAALMAVLGAEGIYQGTRIGPAGDDAEERRLLGGSFHERFPGLVVPGGGQATDQRAASVRDQLASRLGISGAAASGLVSNFDAESGIRGINEQSPAVPGSRGGFGWAQWTGSRRDAFDAYVSRNPGMNPASDEANAGFLEEELRTKFPELLAQLRRGDITPTEAANQVFSKYESGGDPGLEHHRAGHVGRAESIARLPTTVPRTGPTFGPQLPPQSALDPGIRFALRSPSTSIDNSKSMTASHEVNINGPIAVHTTAGDADGVAKGLFAALRNSAIAFQSNYGLA